MKPILKTLKSFTFLFSHKNVLKLFLKVFKNYIRWKQTF